MKDHPDVSQDLFDRARDLPRQDPSNLPPASLEHFQAMALLSPEALVVVASDRIVLCNEAFAKLLDKNNYRDLHGEHLSGYFSEEEKEKFHQWSERSYKGEHSGFIESRILTAGGSPRDVEYYSAPFQFEDRRAVRVYFRDITRRKDAQRRLLSLSNQQNLILEFAGEGIFGVDRNGNTTFVNQAALNLLGFQKEELLHKHQHEIGFHSHNGNSAYSEEECPILLTLNDGKVRTVSYDFFFTTEKTRFPVEYTVTPILENGEISGAVVIFRDTTARILMERELKLSRALFESTVEAMMITDESFQIVEVNPAFTGLTGYTEREIVGKNPSILRSGKHDKEFYEKMFETLEKEGHWRGEIWNRKKSGEIYVQRLTISVIHDLSGKVSNYVSVFSDITEERREKDRATHRAYHDALTELPNRVLLMDRLQNSIQHTSRQSRVPVILFLDLDHFKPVNDTYGHLMGDLLLTEIAMRLRKATRESDTVARLGGDEFVVLMDAEKEQARESVNEAALRIVSQIEEPFDIQGTVLTIGVSVGIAIYPQDGETPEDLLQQADRAMYSRKGKSKGKIAFANESDD